MFTGERSVANSRSEIVRECPGNPGVRDCVSGRGRGEQPQLLYFDDARHASGLHWRRQGPGRDNQLQRAHLPIASGLFFLLLACGLGCRSYEHPQASFVRVQLALQHGDLIRAQQYAERNYQRFRSSSPEWAWKFRILEAESLLLRGMSQEALDLLSGLSAPPTDRTSVIQKLTVEG